MALSVKPLYNQQTITGVVRNYGMQSSTNTIQRTAPIRYVQPAAPTRTVQRTVTTRRLQPAANTAAVQAAARARQIAYQAQQIKQAALVREMQRRADQARIAAAIAAEKKRVRDAINGSIAKHKGSFMGKLTDKVGLGGFLLARKKREAAYKAVEYNSKEWWALNGARQRQYERDAMSRKAALMKRMNDPDWDKQIERYNKWAEDTYKSIVKDAEDYNKTQKELGKYAESRVGGRVAGGITKVQKGIGFVLAPAAQAWNFAVAAAQAPSRGVNTLLTLNTPNRDRIYYGDKSKNTPIIGIKDAWNASKDQRLLGRTAADTAKQLKGGVRYARIDGKVVKMNHKPTWLSKALIKYGDDISDLIVDPMNVLGGLGVGSKVIDKTSSIKTKFFDSKVMQQLGGTKVGTAAKWLNAESRSRSEIAADKIRDVYDKIKISNADLRRDRDAVFAASRSEVGQINSRKSQFITRAGGVAQTLQKRADTIATSINAIGRDFIKELDDFTDDEVRAMTKWARTGIWSGHLSDVKKTELQRLVTSYNQTAARLMADADNLSQAQRARRYLPDIHGVETKPYDFRARRSIFNLGRKGYQGQSRSQLQQSMLLRENQSHMSGLSELQRQAASIGKSIRRNARKTQRGLSELELERMAAYDRRAHVLNQMRVGHQRSIDDLMVETSKIQRNARPLARLRRGRLQTNVSFRGARNTAVDLAGSPLRLWKKSVLKYRPAWYVNNLAWNIPAAISAGGPRAAAEMVKLTLSRKYRDRMSDATKPFGTTINREIGEGRLSALARRIEDIPRSAAGLSLKKQGYNDEQSLKRVNDWLFSYKNKRFEQPIRQILPFYNWSKGLTKLAATMPFRYPRQAALYTKAYQQFYQRPYDQLPKGEQTYIDQSTGETKTYNPRQKYKGKLRIGNKWINTPFNALTPTQLGQINMNPLITYGGELATSQDRYGNPTTDRGIGTLAGEQFPQFKLGRDFARRNLEKFRRWFATGSGYSKEAQGSDPSAKNYMGNLDLRQKYNKTLKSFLGIPSAVTRDPIEEKKHLNYTNFNNEYFKVDWDKRLKELINEDPATAYERVSAEKRQIAKKHGYDFDKDIQDGLWSKYDTATTSNTKRLKEEAFNFQKAYWAQYKNLPKPKQYVGSNGKTYWTASTAKPFWLDKFNTWFKEGTLESNPYYTFPHYNKKDAAGKKIGEDYIIPAELHSKSGGKRKTAVQYNGKWFKSTATRDKYIRGMQKKADYDRAKRSGDWSDWRRKYGDTRKQSPYRYDGKFFKSAESMGRYIAGKARWDAGNRTEGYDPKSSDEVEFWRKYYSTENHAERQAMLEANPQYRRFKLPTTDAEWDAYKAARKTRQIEALSKHTNFAGSREKWLKSIPAGMRPVIPKSKKVVFKV